MKTLLTTTAALILGLSVQAIAVAGDGHGRSGQQNSHTPSNGQVHVTNQGNGQVIQNTGNHKTTITPIQTGTIQATSNLGKVINHTGTGAIGQGTGIAGTGKNAGTMGAGSGKNGMGKGKYPPFKDYKGTCYYGKHCNFWSKSCYNEVYGCYTFWCPRTLCWFYWCQPYGCYLPVDYCPAGTYVFEL